MNASDVFFPRLFLLLLHLPPRQCNDSAAKGALLQLKDCDISMILPPFFALLWLQIH